MKRSSLCDVRVFTLAVFVLFGGNALSAHSTLPWEVVEVMRLQLLFTMSQDNTLSPELRSDPLAQIVANHNPHLPLTDTVRDACLQIVERSIPEERFITRGQLSQICLGMLMLNGHSVDMTHVSGRVHLELAHTYFSCMLGGPCDAKQIIEPHRHTYIHPRHYGYATSYVYIPMLIHHYPSMLLRRFSDDEEVISYVRQIVLESSLITISGILNESDLAMQLFYPGVYQTALSPLELGGHRAWLIYNEVMSELCDVVYPLTNTPKPEWNPSTDQFLIETDMLYLRALLDAMRQAGALAGVPDQEVYQVVTQFRDDVLARRTAIEDLMLESPEEVTHTMRSAIPQMQRGIATAEAFIREHNLDQREEAAGE